MILKNKLLILSLLLLPFFGFSQSVHELARTGTVDSMKALLDKDPSSVNRLSERGITPFVLACYRGNNDVAKLLAKRGADIRYCAAEGSALYGIIFKNNLEMLSFILDQGVSPDDTCQFQQFGTALHMAMSLKRYEMVSLLLSKNPNLKMLDPKGQSIQDLLLFYQDERLTTIFKSHEKN
jgi:ankyrin repeat protein